jgi:antitoxin HigA-1
MIKLIEALTILVAQVTGLGAIIALVLVRYEVRFPTTKRRSNAHKETITAMKRLTPVHPGEILAEDFMKPLGLSQYRLAKEIGVPARRINEIVQGKRAITPETALRLERFLTWPAQVWLNLQSYYDMQRVVVDLRSTLRKIRPYSELTSRRPRRRLIPA